MKLHYSIILLFVHLLNILVTSSYAHNKTKPCITTHIQTTTSRKFSECDIDMRNYDNDQDMKSVKENFDRQTSERFKKYNKSMIKKRQKYKEQCDKDIQKIIAKYKIEKSLEEKMEKGCLNCGCALGGVATSVGLLGTAVVSELTKAATGAAVDLAIQEGINAGIEAAITTLKDTSAFVGLKDMPWSNLMNAGNYNTVDELLKLVAAVIESTGENCASNSENLGQLCNAISANIDGWFSPIAQAGEKATTAKVAIVKAAELAKVTTTSTSSYFAIAYSVIAILIIVLIMVIIHLILRYRRKKKMNKKLQYTKLLN
ncbi:rifin [Plasmodium sp. gorilla clade G1]|nr:rifin [Plasmodium sp. gorilla clade G1]